MAFTLAQQRALAILPKITGGFSVLFSALIAVMILNDDSRRRLAYHRLLLGISIADMSASFWMFCSTWPIPAESDAMWAVGSNTSCSIQGFFLQFGVSSPFYNASLSIYYWLVIVRGWKEADIHRVEWLLHGFPLGWAAVSAITGIALQVYENANLWCWVGSRYKIFRWAAYYGPLWCMIVVATVCCISIYFHVRRYALRAHIRVQESRQHDSSSRTTSHASLGMNHMQRSFRQSLTMKQRLELHNQQNSMEMDALDEDNERGRWDEEHQDRSGSIKHATDSDDGCNNNESEDDDPYSSAASTAERRIEVTRKFQEHLQQSRLINRQSRRLREVARQCFWYAAAFYVNFAALSALRLMQTVEPGRVSYPLVLLAAMTVPIQGLPNFIIYLRPKLRKMMETALLRFCCCCCRFEERTPWWYRLAQSLADRNNQNDEPTNTHQQYLPNQRQNFSSAGVVNLNPTILNDSPCYPVRTSPLPSPPEDMARGDPERLENDGSKLLHQQQQRPHETQTVIVAVDTRHGRKWCLESKHASPLPSVDSTVDPSNDTRVISPRDHVIREEDEVDFSVSDAQQEEKFVEREGEDKGDSVHRHSSSSGER